MMSAYIINVLAWPARRLRDWINKPAIELARAWTNCKTGIVQDNLDYEATKLNGLILNLEATLDRHVELIKAGVSLHTARMEAIEEKHSNDRTHAKTALRAVARDAVKMETAQLQQSLDGALAIFRAQERAYRDAVSKMDAGFNAMRKETAVELQNARQLIEAVQSGKKVDTLALRRATERSYPAK